MGRFFSQWFLFWRATFALFFVCSLLTGGLFPRFAFSASPSNIISYQGRLLNSNRVPVSDATASILFELYTASSGGSCVWSNSSATCASATARTVELTDGLFSEYLGDTSLASPYAAIGDSIFGDNGALYLQITINGETLTPRKRIVASPYALNSSLLAGLASDDDGSTSAAIVALNSSGNINISGTPGASASDASLYINPAASDVAVDDFLLGLAVDGTSIFTVDAEGDVVLNDLTVGGEIVSSEASVDVFDDVTTLAIDFGGVTSDVANTINIATNGTTADAISIGNSHGSTTLSLSSGSWGVTSLGAATFSGMNCTDCIDWSDFSDLATLDAHTEVQLGGSNFTVNVNGTGSVFTELSGTGGFYIRDSGSSAFQVDSSGEVRVISTTSSSSTFSVLSSGSSDVLLNVDSRARSSGGNVVKIGNNIGTDADLTMFIVDSATAVPTTNLAALNGGVFYNSTSHKMYVIENGTAKILCNTTDAGCGAGGSSTLQSAYGADSDGNDAVIALTSGDDSIIFRNPSSSGTDSGYILSLDQLSLGDVDALRVNNAGTGDIFVGMDNGTEVFVLGDGGWFASTNTSSTPISIDLNGSGDFVVRNSSVPIFTVNNTGTVDIDDAYTVSSGDRGGALFINSAWSGTFDSGAGNPYLFSAQINADYSAEDAVGTAPRVYGQHVNVSLTGSSRANEIYGLLAQVESQSSDSASVGSGIFSLYGRSAQNSAVTIPAAYGVFGSVEANDGIITNAYGVYGTVIDRAGVIDQAYGGYFSNTSDGTSRYGVYGSASGGTSNYGGYFSTTGASQAFGLYVLQDEIANATTTPTAQALVIDVNESQNADEVILIRSGVSGSADTEFRFENDGDAFADGAWTGGGADYAEFFPTTDRTLGDYEVVCWNDRQALGVKRCEAGETDVVGVISTDPGFIGNAYAGAESDLEESPQYALVGLVGQIETLVSAESGPIRIGDALTTSPVRSGYAEKTLGGTYIIGRALENLSSGTGTIKVLVQPMWYGGDLLTLDGEALAVSRDLALVSSDATRQTPYVQSAGLSFVGSSWNGSAAEDVSLSLRHYLDADGSRLSLQNDSGFDVMTFGSTGDLAIAGNFYPSEDGALQYGAYVYYDSAQAGYMRTNASGWKADSSGYAESFSSPESLVSGDVVVFSPDSGVISSRTPYDRRVAGVVSQQSGFVSGGDAGDYSVVVSGRARARVSMENGPILAGDFLATSSSSGAVMKASSTGYVVGYALESASQDGEISVFVRPQFFEDDTGTSASLGSSSDVSTLNVLDVLGMNGGSILSVGTLSGIGGWEIRENGDIVTQGQLTQVVRSLQNTLVSTYPVAALESVVELSGTTVLFDGQAAVRFEDIAPDFNDLISQDEHYRVLVTPHDITGQLYVTDRTSSGFTIRDTDFSSGVSVDWLVQAYRHDFAPEIQVPSVDEAYSEESLQNDSSSGVVNIEGDVPPEGEMVQEVILIEEIDDVHEQVDAAIDEVMPEVVSDDFSEEQVDAPSLDTLIQAPEEVVVSE